MKVKLSVPLRKEGAIVGNIVGTMLVHCVLELHVSRDTIHIHLRKVITQDRVVT